jgi:hypothetical protein
MALDPLTAAMDIGGKLIDHFFPDAEKQAAARLELLKLQQSGALATMVAQTDTNKVEAASTNMFVAGWRPAIGWICGLGLLSQFVIGPFATWGAALCGKILIFPSLDMGTLLTLLMGMLGLGGMRTYEKIQDVVTKH